MTVNTESKDNLFQTTEAVIVSQCEACVWQNHGWKNHVMVVVKTDVPVDLGDHPRDLLESWFLVVL